ncbi:MAG: glycosyltransferase [Promethearchaeota archaeon]
MEMKKSYKTGIISFKKQYPYFLYPGKKRKIDSDNKEFNISQSILNWYSYKSWRKASQIINQNAEVVYIPYWTMLLALPIIYIAKNTIRNGIKVIVDFHNLYDHDAGFIKRNLTTMILKKLVKYTTLCIFHSKMNHYILKKISQKQINSLIVPLGYLKSLDKSQKLKNYEEIYQLYGLEPNINYILMFGIIRKYKGLKYAIEAMKYLNNDKCANYKLLVIGEIWMDLTQELKLIEKYNLKNKIIIINKFIPDEHIISIFKMSKIVIYPYLNATQSGSLPFAFKCCKPVIATKVGQFKEIIDDGKNGILITPGNSKELALAILDVLKNKNLFNELALNGFLFYKENLLWDKIISKILKKIEEI